MIRRAFVTGATGFVGLNLVKTLIEEGWQVTALHRATSELTFLKRFGADLVVGAITDPGTLATAMPRGIDTVFHVAGNTNMWGARNAQQTHDNVDGTRNVVEAAIVRGARRLVVTSSISAYGPVSGVVTETAPSLAADSWINYERTKYQAQEIARAATSRGLEVVIMQPGAIMGPYDVGTWSRLFPLIRDGKLPGVPPAQLSFAHVREVARAHIVAADQGENGGQYLLAGTEASMLQLVQLIAGHLGVHAPSSEMPGWLLKIVANLSDWASRITGKEPVMTPEMASGFGTVITVPCTKAKTELGYQTVPLAEMVTDCYAWLKAEGRV